MRPAIGLLIRGQDREIDPSNYLRLLEKFIRGEAQHLTRNNSGRLSCLLKQPKKTAKRTIARTVKYSDDFAQKTDGSSKLRQRLGDEGWQENLRLQRT